MGPRPLSAVDAAWFRMDVPGNPVDVTAVLVFDGPFPDDRLRALLESRLLVHRRFRERICETRFRVGRPRWEPEPAFSLDAHLEHETLPEPGGRAQLEELVARWMNTPFDRSRSPWRLVRVDGYSRGTALIAHLHHAMGDGFALVDVLLSLSEDRPAHGARASRAARWFRGGVRWKEAPAVAMSAARGLTRLVTLSFDTPSGLQGPTSGLRRAAWSDAISLAQVKGIARSRGFTVNDVLMSALSGAVRRYLAERGEPIDELSIRAVMPVNLRPAGVPVDLEHGNWFGLVFVDLPIAMGDPDARLGAIHRTIERLKASQEPTVALALLNVIGRLPAPLARVLELVFVRKSSLVVTNVPGPRERVRIAHVPLAELVFWVPHPARLALGVSILSYAGEIRVGARSDEGAVADPARIVELVEDELVTLGRGCLRIAHPAS